MTESLRVPRVPEAEMTESSRVPRVLKAEMTESSRVPRVLKAEMTESSRVPGVLKAEMTESSRVPRVLKAEMTGTRRYWYSDDLWRSAWSSTCFLGWICSIQLLTLHSISKAQVSNLDDLDHVSYLDRDLSDAHQSRSRFVRCVLI